MGVRYYFSLKCPRLPPYVFLLLLLLFTWPFFMNTFFYIDWIISFDKHTTPHPSLCLNCYSVNYSNHKLRLDPFPEPYPKRILFPQTFRSRCDIGKMFDGKTVRWTSVWVGISRQICSSWNSESISYFRNKSESSLQTTNTIPLDSNVELNTDWHLWTCRSFPGGRRVLLQFHSDFTHPE